VQASEFISGFELLADIKS
jgi:hypothetical protein